jgi:hypothetical protein
MQMTRELSSEAAISRFQRYFSPTKHRRSINDGCTANAQQQANCSLDETTEKERLL